MEGLKFLLSCRHNSWKFPWNRKHFSTSTFTFFQTMIHRSCGPWDRVCCENICGRFIKFTSQSKENTNDRCCFGNYRTTTVNSLIWKQVIFSSVETLLCASCMHLTSVIKFSQALIKASCMYTHKPALNLNSFFILNIYVKGYSYFVANSSQHNTTKF